jgi:hypothetical protein
MERVILGSDKLLTVFLGDDIIEGMEQLANVCGIKRGQVKPGE